MSTRRGKTIRFGSDTFRITKPAQRCRFGIDDRSVSLGWLIISYLNRTPA